MKLRGILIDVENEEVKCIEIEDTLDEYYRILNCDTIDIVNRRIGRKRFEIICDDEGTFKANPKISAIDNFGTPQLVGNIFIVGGEVDEDGNLTSLTKSDAKYVMDRVVHVCTRQFIDGYPMLTQCEY